MDLREVIGSAPLLRVTRPAYGPGYTFPTHVLHTSSRICACPTLELALLFLFIPSSASCLPPMPYPQ
jgi:hypothetical protein